VGDRSRTGAGAGSGSELRTEGGGEASGRLQVAGEGDSVWVMGLRSEDGGVYAGLVKGSGEKQWGDARQARANETGDSGEDKCEDAAGPQRWYRLWRTDCGKHYITESAKRRRSRPGDKSGE
jgi:hypothetical protein